ncbi:hypothetical protein [Burkholderia multivorans]|uniref:hypothetical protein n=1 Tax=Burkholderia multivorans TaxID=87883 RepID=UPI0015903069|nr:hypothetical protein [Burkholderia multivorans]
MQKYDFTAPASGAPQVVNVPGRYLKYVTGTAGGNDTGLIVTPGGKPGNKILLYPGQAITLPNDGTAGPNAWTIANAIGQGQITGTVVIGNGRIDDNTLQGSVQVIDGGKSRSLAGNVFWGYKYAVPVASQAGFVQLWNPAGSGKRLVVAQIQFAFNQSASTIGHLSMATAAIDNVAGQVSSKLLGGAGPTAGVIYAKALAAPPAGYQSIGDLYNSAPSNETIRFTEPFIVPPGYGLMVDGNGSPNSANVGLSANFEFYEEPNV